MVKAVIRREKYRMAALNGYRKQEFCEDAFNKFSESMRLTP